MDRRPGPLIAESTAVVHPGVELPTSGYVGTFTELGKLHRTQRQAELNGDVPLTIIGSDVVIESHCVIYAGATLEADVICNDYVSIGGGTTVGRGAKLQYRSQIHDRVRIGSGCRIGGFLCDDTIIGPDTSFYGKSVHRYAKHGASDVGRAPHIGSDVVVAFDALVVGAVTVGDGSYVAPGAIVTKDVPPGTLVTGVNQQKVYGKAVQGGSD